MLIPEGHIHSWAMCRRSPASARSAWPSTFHRLLMPDGYSVDLDQFHGLDQAGETGLKDKVNNHYLANLRHVDRAGHYLRRGGGDDQRRLQRERLGHAIGKAWRPACRSRAPTCSTASSTFRRPSRFAKAIGSRSISPRTCCCPRMRTTRCRPISERLRAATHQSLPGQP